MNYYELLQIKNTATSKEIEAAYRHSASIYHPDKYPGNTKFSEDMMSSLNAAVGILCEPAERKKYDRWLKIQADELRLSRASRSKNNKNGSFYPSNAISKKYLKALKIYLMQNKLLIIIVFVIFLFLVPSPIQYSINSIYKEALLGETSQLNKQSNVSASLICNPKKIIADANNDGLFSYSDIPQLVNDIYQNTGKFIARELAKSKIGIFFEIKVNSCNSAAIIIFSILGWTVIATILIYAVYYILELFKRIIWTLFFEKLKQIPSKNILRAIYLITFSRKFNLLWIRYILFFFIALGIFNYFKFYNVGKPQNKLEAPGKNSLKANTPLFGKGQQNTEINQGDISDYHFLALNLVNEVRSKGIYCGGKYFPSTSPLKLNDPLTNAAKLHATNMAEMNYFSHVGLDGKTLSTRVSEQGYRWSIVGENIAAGQSSIGEAVNSWIKSTGHCTNLMDPRFTEMGVSKASSSNSNKFKLYWVQTLAAPN